MKMVNCQVCCNSIFLEVLLYNRAGFHIKYLQLQGWMRRVQMRLIFLYFLEIYAGMTVITVVIAGEYLMEITSECGARTLYMIKARF
jgi:hypothetical protein